MWKERILRVLLTIIFAIWTILYLTTYAS